MVRGVSGGSRGDVVRAAGGLVVKAEAGHVHVLVVHRPQYDDWSFPKGKVEPGESDEECARREVEEETGLDCELEDELRSTAYVDRHGRDKVVRYWVMRPRRGEARPCNEVDDVRWLAADAARELLTYEHDRLLLDDLVSR